MEYLFFYDGSHAFERCNFFKISVGFPVTKHLIYNCSVDTGLVENEMHLLKLPLFLYKTREYKIHHINDLSMFITYNVQTYRKRLNDL